MFTPKDSTKQARPVVNTPADFTEANYNKLVEDFSAHFTTAIPPTIMIGNRKGAYACIINGTYQGIALEAIAGTVNAKAITNAVMHNIMVSIATVPTR